MIFIEIGLTITAFKRGWRWRALWPIGIVAGMAFLIGVRGTLAGFTARELREMVLMVFPLELAMVGVMGRMAYKGRPTGVQSNSAVETPASSETLDHQTGMNILPPVIVQ